MHHLHVGPHTITRSVSGFSNQCVIKSGEAEVRYHEARVVDSDAARAIRTPNLPRQCREGIRTYVDDHRSFVEACEILVHQGTTILIQRAARYANCVR